MRALARAWPAQIMHCRGWQLAAEVSLLMLVRVAAFLFVLCAFYEWRDGGSALCTFRGGS